MADTLHDQMAQPRRAPVAKRLDTFSWGLFFIWIGVAFVANVGWGVGMLGVALIVLGAQATRKYFDVPVERFWLVMGVVFLVWAGFDLLDVQLREGSIPRGAMPILFIALGIVLVAVALLRKR